MKQKKIIVIGAALIAIVLIVTGVLAALMYNGGSGTSYVENGYRYLQEGDFNNAILQFRLAIEEDSTNEDAYYGLYQAYLHSGQNDLAATTLRMGITSTHSSKLQEMLEQLQAIGNTTVDQPSGNAGADQLDNKDIVAILNVDLLNLFASATYGDYCVQYGTEAGGLNGGEYTRYLASIGATLVYYNSTSERVLDASRGVPYNQYLPNEIRLDNIMNLFGGGRQITFDQIRRLSGVSDAAMNGNAITFTHRGCEVRIICAESGVVTHGCENHIIPTSTSLEEEKEFVLAATVLDATTGRPVTGAKIKVYEGYNTFGTPEEGDTDGSGKLNLNIVSSGTYTVVIEKEGYIKENFEVFILSNVKETMKTFHLSPTISGDGIRFVLTWGASPSDLDSYLVGTAGDGTSVNVNFTNMSVSNAENTCIAELDVDDINSFGPETVTLYDTTGSYEFYVDDFTDSGSTSTSGATVKIYVGSTLYATVSVPGGVTDMWHVCTVNNGQITVTNRAY